MLIESIRALAQFGPGHFTPVTLARTEHSDMKVVGLEAGQAIPVHHPNSDLTMVVIEGEATLVAGEEELAHAGPGAVLHAKAGEARGIHADQRTILVVVASPPPTPEDHRELAEHFAKGTWR
jgi:quercetin dioxygenase-like cupin family protein